MTLAFYLIIVGATLLLGVYLVLRQPQPSGAPRQDRPPVPVNLANTTDAVVLSSDFGRVIFANAPAREWFAINGGEPDLELMAELVQPADRFRDLFAAEGRASFQLGARRVEAASFRLPTEDTRQTVVVMRDMAAARTAYGPSTMRALVVLGDVGKQVVADASLPQVLDAMLAALSQGIEFTAGTVALARPGAEELDCVAERGDPTLLRALRNVGGVYQEGEGYSGWLCTYRESLLVEDVSQASGTLPVNGSVTLFRSYIGTPLLVGNDLVGVLQLVGAEPNAFSYEDLVLLEAVASQAAAVIDKERLHSELDDQADALTGIRAVVGAASLASDRSDLFYRLTHEIAAAVGVEMCGVLVHDAASNLLVAQSSFYGIPPSMVESYRVALGEGPAAQRIWEREDGWHSNWARDERIMDELGFEPELLDVLNIRSLAFVPLTIGSRRIGLLHLANPQQGGNLTADHMVRFRLFAAQAAIVVESAMLLDHAQQHRDRMRALLEVGRLVGQADDLAALYGEMNARIADLLAVEMVGVLLHDPAQEALVGQTPYYGVDDQLLQYIRVPVTPGNELTRIWQEDDFWLCNRLETDRVAQAGGLAELTTWVGITQVLLAPLVLDGARVGAVLASNRRGSLGFDEDDARLLNIFAAQLAVMLENTRLREDIGQHEAEVQLLRGVAEIANSGAPLDAVMAELLPALTGFFRCDVALVDFLDEDTGALRIDPAHVAGAELDAPLMADVYVQDFQHSVVLSGRPFLSDDLASDRRVLAPYRQAIDRLGLRNIVMVPLLVRGRGVGELAIANRPGGFQAQDQRVLEIAAAQLSAAVERARLQGATDEALLARVAELDSLGRVSTELTTTVELDRITTVLRQEALRVTEAEACTILLFAPTEEWGGVDQPEVMRRYGEEPAFHAEDDLVLAPLEQVAVEQMVATYVPDYAQHPLAAFPVEAVTALAVPILYGQRVVGVLHLYDGQPDALDDRARQFVTSLAEKAAVAYHNAARFREQISRNQLLNQRVDQLNRIFELSGVIRARADAESILEEVAHSVQMSVGFSVVMFSLLDEAAGVYYRVAQAGIPLATFAELRQTVTPRGEIEALLEDRYRISNSYFLPAEQEDEWRSGFSRPDEIFHYHREYLGDTQDAWHPDDALLVPLRGSQEQLLGFMSVDAPADGRRPIKTTVETLEVFAYQAAIAIENLRLVEATQREAEAARRERDQMQRFYEVSSEVQQAGDVPTRMEIIARGIQDAGWRRVYITLRDENMDPTSLIYVGYSEVEANDLHADLLSGEQWRQYVGDPAFHEQLSLGMGYYLRHDAPWVVKHLRDGQAPETSTPANRWHPDDQFLLPIYGTQSRLIGLIGMDTPLNGRAPTVDSLRPIELFANQAANVIEMTRLYLETSRAAETETLFNEVMQAVTGSLDITATIQGVSDGLQRLIPFTRMMLALHEEGSDYFQVLQVAFMGMNKVQIEPGRPLPLAGTVTGEVYTAGEGRVYFVEDEEDSAAYSDLSAWQETMERTTMLVPMMVGGVVIGVLRLGSELSHAYGFNDENMSLVQRMINLASVAMQNARLYQQTAERERFSAALVRLNSALNATLDLGATLESIGEEALAILDVQGAYIWQWDEKTNALVGLAAVGPGRDSFAGTRVPVEDEAVLAVRVFIEGQPLYLNDVQATDDVRLVLAEYAAAHAIMGVPLLREDRALGVLSLVKIGTTDIFTAGDIERAAVFGTQASIALENARLYQETRDLQQSTAERAEQLSALTEISSQLTATLEPDGVVELVLDYLDEVLAYEGVTLWLREGDNLRIAAARGYDGAADELVGLETAIEDSLLFAEMAERRVTLNIPDVLGDPRFPGSEHRPNRNWLGAPLISKNEIIGLLALDKREPGYYTENAAQLALAFANQAAVALENAQLFAEARRRTGTLSEQAQRLGLVNRVATKLAQSLDVENIFEVALIESAEALAVPTARAVLFDIQQQLGSVIVDYPRGDAPPTEVMNLGDNPAVDYVRRTLQPLVVEDVRQDPLLQSWQEELAARGIAALAVVPLSVGGQVIGALILEGHEPGIDFTPEQVELVQTIASQAAIAVQNANLFEQSVIRTRELETLFDASQATALSLDLDEVIHSVAQQMLHALQADTCAVMLTDALGQNLVVQADLNIAGDAERSVPIGTTYALSDYPARQEVLASRGIRVLTADDADRDAREMAEMDALGSKMRMLVPLVVREEAMGLIRIDIFTPFRALALSEQRIARALAGQAATFIENARLNAETEAQVQEAFILNDISRAMSAVVTMDEVMPIVRDRIPSLRSAEWLYFALYDAAEERLDFPVVVYKGQPVEFATQALGQDEFSHIVRFRRPLLLVGDELMEVRQSLSIETSVPDLLSFLGVPVVYGDELIGVLALGDDDNATAFSVNDQRILSTVAGQLAVTIQNARLYEQLEARVRIRTEEVRAERDRLNTLYNITAELSATLDMDRVLERALDLLAGAVGGEQGDIMLINHQQNRLYVRAEMGRGRVVGGGGPPDQRGLGVNEGLAGWVIQHRQSVVIEDVQRDPRWLQVQPEDKMPRSALAVLLETSDEILGVLMLYSSTAGVFHDEHLRLVTAAARQLSTAINNAELYFFIREQAERLGDLLREQQIESSKSNAILEGVADGVMVADELGNISLFNSAAERILEIERRSVMGQPFRHLSGLYSGGGQRWMQSIEEWMRDPSQINPGDFVSERLELGDKIINVLLSPVHMGDQFLGTVSVFRDITRDVEVDRMKTEFISNVSHELRTPMTSIKGYADLLMLGAAGDISERQQGFLSTIKINADRLSNLVNDLLNISRLDAGRAELDFQPVKLGALAEGSLANLVGRIEMEKKAITVESDIPDDLPETYGDEGRLIQVITNLVDNAFQYTPEGGKITLHVEYQAAERAFLLTVADTGIGIPKRHQERIFERFFRNDDHPLVMETPGTGLGLAIVKELVEMHGGDISFVSEEGAGTTFFVKLPHYTEAPPMDTLSE